MPYSFDNDNKTSEATLTLVYPKDWTVNDVNTLTLYFRGDVANAAERMYVALNDSAVVYHDDPGATQIPLWMGWNIELKAFADQGVDLTNVNTISVGLGEKNNPQAGGSGTMYFDDIRLATSAGPVGRLLLLAENFDGVELGASPEESPGTADVWTDTPPTDWVVDESGVPGIGDPAIDGVTDWAGWAFADKDFWVSTKGSLPWPTATSGMTALIRRGTMLPPIRMIPGSARLRSTSPVFNPARFRSSSIRAGVRNLTATITRRRT